MKNYEKLKKIIQDANPKIMELKFGCYVTGMGYSNSRVCLIDGKDIYLNKGDYCISKTKLKDIKQNCKWENEIRLADVLLALMKFYLDGKKSSEVKDILYKLAHEWNCFDDNLDNQFDETKQFLIDLLV